MLMPSAGHGPISMAQDPHRPEIYLPGRPFVRFDPVGQTLTLVGTGGYMQTALVCDRAPDARGAWLPWAELTLQSANYRDRYNTELDRAPARLLLSGGVARTWPGSWLDDGTVLTVGVGLRNVTDNDIYDVEGFPLPGRTWRLYASVGREP